MSNSLWPHGLQHARLPCPSPTLGSCSNSYPSTISFSVITFSSCLQSFLASGSFQMSQFLTSSGQSTRVSASISVLPMNIQDWLPLGLTGWISLQSKWLSSLLQYHSSKSSVPQCSAFFMAQFSHPYMTTGKTIALTRWTFVAKVMSLLFTKLYRLVFLPWSKDLFDFMAAVTICSDFGAQENKVCYYFPCCPIYLPWNDRTRCHTLSFFLMLSFNIKKLSIIKDILNIF